MANQLDIPPQRLRAALAHRAAALAEKIAAVRAAADAQPHAPGFVRAIFDYSLTQLEAEQRWLSGYVAELTDAPNREETRR